MTSIAEILHTDQELMMHTAAQVGRDYRTSDILTWLHKTDSTVRAWVRGGRFPRPTGRVGVAPVWSSEVLDAWAAAQGVTPIATAREQLQAV